MVEQRIQQHFFEAADLFNRAADLLGRPLAQAAQAVVACVTAGGKLLVAGSDEGAALAPVAAAAFTGRFERDRPPIAALALSNDALQGPEQALRALAQPGDLLLAFDAGGASQRLFEAARAARSLDMGIVVITGPQTGQWKSLLSDTDILITVPHERAARVSEAQLLALHGLCDAVDLHLLGEGEFE